MNATSRLGCLRPALLSLAACAALLTACGDHDHGAEPYPTLQGCYDDHHTVEALSVTASIVVCCTDHVIGGVTLACGNTQAACETFVNAELTDVTTPAEITTACTDYITQLGM